MLVKFRRTQENVQSRKALQEELNDILDRDYDPKLRNEDVVKCCQEQLTSTSLTDSDVCVMVSIRALYAMSVHVETCN